MEIQFRGQYDRHTFFRAVRLANQPTRKQGRFLAIMATFAIIAIGLLLYRLFTSGDTMGSAILLVAALILGVGTAWPFLRAAFTARKLWANPGTRRPLRGVITNQGIRYLLQEGVNEIRWNRFNRVRKTEELVTLVRQDGLLLVFPRAFFRGEADWRKFIRLVEGKVTGS